MTARQTSEIKAPLARARSGWLARAVICGAVALALQAPAAIARPNEAAADIRAVLMQWAADFNARNSAAVCRLFAPDLRYDFRGLPEQRYQDMCNRLNRSLADPATRRHYAFDIKEILVSGDLAVVRLVWHLTTRRAGRPDANTTEPGIDIFRREPDGNWRIIRFLAYDAPAR